MTTQYLHEASLLRPLPPNQRIPVGISQCLLGERVRFDGGHKHSRLCTHTLGDYFDYVGLCPEMGIGMGAPRQAIRLIATDQGIRARGSKDASLDVTDALRDYAAQQSETLERLCGYIFMQKSPTCGMERVKLYDENGFPHDSTAGLYADAVMRAHPLLPVEENGRLNDPILLENFVTRVFTYHEWRSLMGAGITAEKLVDFHSRHKYLIMAHDVTAYRELGRLVAQLKQVDLTTLAQRYIERLMPALRQRASRKKHANVMQHMQGFLKRQLDRDDKQELASLIDQYREGRVPMVVPLTLLKHHLNHSPSAWAKKNVYLQPHPAVLGLRNGL